MGLLMNVQCNFTAHPGCAENPPSLVMNRSIHEHTLTLFPRDVDFICNVCGLLRRYRSPYVCLKCGLMIHADCIDTPRVIRISRHEHRLSLILFLGPGEWICGVCRVWINGKYGAYRCVKGCLYAVHTRCATREDVWDGEELEGVPEEEIDERIIEELGDGLIRHFSHDDEHVLRLENEDIRDVVCSGCSFPLASNPFYRCQQCDFFLHVACAFLPRKKALFLHKHPLTLCTEDERSGGPIGLSHCSACELHFSGFRYRCLQCKDDNIGFDIRCSFVSQPLDYPLHRHLFFFQQGSPIEPPQKKPSRCSFCNRHPLKYLLTCMECDDVALCFACATTPHKVIYKYDEHLLSHTIGEEDVTTNPYWCDICENKIQEKKHHYKCSDCGPVLHADCVLGSFRNMRPGFSFTTQHGHQFEVILNDRTSLLRRSQCHNDCPEPLLLMSTTTTTTTTTTNVTIYLCSSTCFDTYVSV